ncbi:MAG: Sjogren's syndrome/scleroderma autoantigen 1 family protein [Nitrososphaerota archaeon]|nr:hypothetical protein [Candidatus Bathyarchaeota archaeon]MDW8049017.1 Sjogren's syndrome/scleroderma autoantigen 1 family protein [Nitrososphaerota archaeon]
MSGDNDEIRLMADMLRSGATLTDLSCPACASPIFRMKDGTLWCAHCNKKVIILKEGSSEQMPIQVSSLNTLESILLMKIEEIQMRIKDETDVEELKRLSEVTSLLLENLERVRRIAKSSR